MHTAKNIKFLLIEAYIIMLNFSDHPYQNLMGVELMKRVRFLYICYYEGMLQGTREDILENDHNSQTQD
jgi:hypothetical protein